jgi:hypothetical protein
MGNYNSDVSYEVWRAGGNPDRLDYDRLDHYRYNGDSPEEAACSEIRRWHQQEQRKREEREQEEYEMQRSYEYQAQREAEEQHYRELEGAAEAAIDGPEHEEKNNE